MPLHLPGKKSLEHNLEVKKPDRHSNWFHSSPERAVLMRCLRCTLMLWSLKALIACFPVGVSSGRQTWP